VANIFKIETYLVDTGILYAFADRKDKWHLRAASFIDESACRLVVPSTVLPETCYLLNTCIGQAAEIAFIRAIIDRELIVDQVTTADLIRVAELMVTYSDANIGMVDASLVAVAERLKVSKILTTDRRHFAMIKPKHCKSFQLLP